MHELIDLLNECWGKIMKSPNGIIDTLLMQKWSALFAPLMLQPLSLHSFPHTTFYLAHTTHQRANARVHAHTVQGYWFAERCGRAALPGRAPRMRHTIGSGCAAPKLSPGAISEPCRFVILIPDLCTSLPSPPPAPLSGPRSLLDFGFFLHFQPTFCRLACFPEEMLW